MHPLIQVKRATPLFLVALACFGLLPKAQAVSPAPDGGYPGFTTAEGQNALLQLTTGTANTGVGWFSLESVTTGSFNTAIGAGTLFLNTADQNTATGAGALLSNTTGFGNTGNGAFALFNNTTGHDNTANGGNALFHNTIGHDNTADGGNALFHNITGHDNTANGSNALFHNTAGDSNTANGFEALFSNTTGVGNTAIGDTALGGNTTGAGNTALGEAAGGNVITASSVICIGTPGADVSNSCFIGNIRGITTANADAVPVLIDSAGQLGTVSSSARFKREIKLMDHVSESILALKPVTFQYKSDNTGTPQFGLIAEEVAAVNPDLVVRDKNGEIYTVRYDAVNAMLLNEFLKEHRTVQELKKEIAALTATVKEQASQIQKVSAHFDVSKTAPQIVLNNQ
jgi:hypothetical protein